MKVLGIWDGHDSGAALVENDKTLFAVNEERFSRRKLEIAFPENAIRACLANTQIRATDLSEIAISTCDFAKTLTRVLPSLKEEYYLIRRRKKGPAGTSPFKKRMKYRLTEFGPSTLTHLISKHTIQKRMEHLGFRDFRLHIIDHHYAHAASAAFFSGYQESLVVTLDGLGDGLSGSVYRFKNGSLQNLAHLSARHSLGIFFEHVTNLMNMRELEDEGKVMALANYAYPVEDARNPLLDLIHVKGLTVQCRYSSLGMYNALKEILWHYPSEQFAFMAQRTLELRTMELIQNALKLTENKNICLAGGLFSNVKVNRRLRLLPQVKSLFVFPHMGDGGLALGAAVAANAQLNGISRISLDHLFLGPAFSDVEVEGVLRKSGLHYKKSTRIAKETAHLLAKGAVVLWFQGRLELGPRALGGRSILARADSESIKDKLNLQLKKRVWYQPFCPAMLEADAEEILEDYDGNPNEFMTMAYMVRAKKRHLVKGAINVDGSCRPQIVRKRHALFHQLLKEFKELTGHGIVLNTSLNIHGEPIVCSPKDAVSTFKRTKSEYMAIQNFLVSS